MSDIEESAKAAAETAKFGTTSIEAATKMGSFLARIFGMPFENAVGIIGDQIEYTRWERQNRLVDKVIEEQNKRGLTKFRPIPPKFAIPIISSASMEEDDYLQDIWCKLIANCSDPAFNEEIRYAFIDIIKNITKSDAKILKYIYETSIEMNKEFQHTRFIAYPIDFFEIAENLQVSYIETEISLNNLQRVQCICDNDIEDLQKEIYHIEILKNTIRDQFLKSKEPNSLIDSKGDLLPILLSTGLKMDSLLEPIKGADSTILQRQHSRYKITPLGFEFISACIK